LETKCLISFKQQEAEKTLLSAIWLYQAHIGGRKTAANMPFSFLDKELDTFEEFEA